MRNDQYTLVKTQIENCTTGQLEDQYEFFTIDDAAASFSHTGFRCVADART